MNVLYARLPGKRKPAFRLLTAIAEDGGNYFVLKRPLAPEAADKPRLIYENRHILAAVYGEEHLPQAALAAGNTLLIEYVAGETLEQKVIEAIRRGDGEALAASLRLLQQIVRGRREPIAAMRGNWLDLTSPKRQYEMDLGLDNIVVRSDGTWVLIDFEYLSPSVSRDFVLLRALLYFCALHEGLLSGSELDFGQIAGLAGIEPSRDLVDEFLKRDAAMAHPIVETYSLSYAQAVSKVTFNDGRDL